MRSIATAAKEAVSGADETLWQACYEIARDLDMNEIFSGNGKVTFEVCERALRVMKSEERKLYGVSDE